MLNSKAIRIFRSRGRIFISASAVMQPVVIQMFSIKIKNHFFKRKKEKKES
jgi:hypothetical protein